MENTKRCNGCKQQLPLVNFFKNKRASDGHAYTCKSCIKAYQLSVKDKLKAYQHEYQKQYRTENKEKLLAYDKEWKENNKEKQRGYVKKSNAKRKEKLREYMIQYRLRKKLEKQNEQQPTSGAHL